MSTEDMIALAQFDAVAARLAALELAKVAAMLAEHGATPEEVEDGLARARTTWTQWHQTERADLARMLSDPAALTGAMQ